MFDSQRFFRLANAHWAEYRKAYAWFIGIGVMVHFVLLLMIMLGTSGYQEMTSDGQAMVYYAGLFLTGPIFAARYFQLMSKRESALIILMRPAAVFEKWLLVFIVVALLYPVVYTLAFYICDLPAWLIARAQIGDMNQVKLYGSEKYGLFFPLTYPENRKNLLLVFLSLTTFQAFAVLGSLYFKTMPFIKTILTAFFILLAFVFIPIMFHSNPDLMFKYWDEDSIMSPMQLVLYPVMWFSVPALIWLSCYLALKEREVA